jgi:hypothetical protein
MTEWIRDGSSRRPGDPPVLIADIGKLRETLGLAAAL